MQPAEDTMREDGKIDYVEFPAKDLPEVKRFYREAFGWSFVDYGPGYAAIGDAGLEGGFDGSGKPSAPLVILYAHELEAMVKKVEAAGGRITVPIFSFPGGRRFHFEDPSGNTLAVWSET
jgi:hypothetical protein